MDFPQELIHIIIMVSVLLIDDDIHLCEEIRLGLEDAGYEVTVATGDDDGFAAYEREPHDVVITDVVMDDGEGVGTMGPVTPVGAGPARHRHLRPRDLSGDHDEARSQPLAL